MKKTIQESAITIRINEDAKKNLQAYCRRTGLTMSSVLKFALDEYMLAKGIVKTGQK